jgi:hypothetical protein
VNYDESWFIKSAPAHRLSKKTTTPPKLKPPRKRQKRKSRSRSWLTLQVSILWLYKTFLS